MRQHRHPEPLLSLRYGVGGAVVAVPKAKAGAIVTITDSAETQEAPPRIEPHQSGNLPNATSAA